MFRKGLSKLDLFCISMSILVLVLFIILHFTVFACDICGATGNFPIGHYHCPICDSLEGSVGMVNTVSDYCSNCGAVLVPHCIDCGEVCKTAFCKLCGAEQ